MPRKKAVIADGTSIERIQGVCLGALARVTDSIAKEVDERLEVGADCSKQSRALTGILEQTRQIGKAQGHAIRSIDQSTVIAWARAQTPEARAKLVKEVSAIDAPRRSVLG